MKSREWAKGMGQNLSFFCVCVVENIFMAYYKVIKYDSYTRLISYLSFSGICVREIMKTRQINVSVWYVSWTMKYSIVNTFLKHNA